MRWLCWMTKILFKDHPKRAARELPMELVQTRPPTFQQAFMGLCSRTIRVIPVWMINTGSTATTVSRRPMPNYTKLMNFQMLSGISC